MLIAVTAVAVPLVLIMALRLPAFVAPILVSPLDALAGGIAVADVVPGGLRRRAGAGRHLIATALRVAQGSATVMETLIGLVG